MSTLFKSDREHLRYIYWSTGSQFSGKKSLLAMWKSLRPFVNTMTAVDKCSLPDRDNLMQAIHMQLSQKLKTFSWFFSAFSKSTLNFEHFQKKDDAHSLFICGATAAKNVVRYMYKSPTSDYPSKRNIVNGCQLCLNLSESTCGIFVAQREGNLVAKSLF